MLKDITKLYFILSKRHYLDGIMLLLISLLTSVVDISAILILGYFLSILTGAELQSNSFYDLIPQNEILLAIIFCAVTVLRLFLNYIIAWVGMSSEGRLSTLLLKKALSLDLSSFEKGSSADFKREILSEVQQVSISIISPVLRIMQVIPMVLVGLISFIIFFAADSLIYILIILFFSWVGYLLIRKLSAELGKIRFHTNELRFQYLETAFSNVRLIMILSLSRGLVAKYFTNYRKYARAQSLAQIISQIPKTLLEITFIFICAVLFSMSFDGLTFNSNLALTTAAAYKLVPTISLIIQCISRLLYGREAIKQIIKRYYDHADENMKKVLEKSTTADKPKLLTEFTPAPDRIIKINGKIHPKVTIETSKVTVITGSSGVGKTTFIDQLTFLRSEGVIELVKNHIKKDDIFYVPQNPFLMEGTLKENLEFFNIEVDIKDLKILMKKFSVGHLIERLIELKVKLGSTQELSGLSGGEMKRLFLMFSFLSKKKTIFLDEPFSGLDRDNKNKMAGLLNLYFNKVSLFIVTHDMVEEINHDYLLEVIRND